MSRVHRLPRLARRRRYVMCPPEHFAVSYAINPWMDPDAAVDVDRAMTQWQGLHDTYVQLGHEVQVVPPEQGLPDMVFAANGAFVVGGIVIGARFRYPQRAAEADAYAGWLSTAGYGEVQRPQYVNEGEGDFLVSGDTILAGTGFRTDPRAHREVAELTGREVVSLTLVDPRYYHLDTALCVLDDDTIAYLPDAFDGPSRKVLERRYPEALLVSPADAAVLGLNAVSDGRNVVLPEEAAGFAGTLEAHGFTAVPVALDELRKAGGGPKCCTMELRPAADAELAEEVSA